MLRLLALLTKVARYLQLDGVRALRQPIMDAVWQVRFDEWGVMNWRIGTVQLADTMERNGVEPNIVLLHACITELEEDGLLSTHYESGTPERGYKKQRMVTMTEKGRNAMFQSANAEKPQSTNQPSEERQHKGIE